MTLTHCQLFIIMDEFDLAHFHKVLLLVYFVDLWLVTKHNHAITSERSKFLWRVHALEEYFLLLCPVRLIFLLIVQGLWVPITLRSRQALLHLFTVASHLFALQTFDIWELREHLAAVEVLYLLGHLLSLLLIVLIPLLLSLLSSSLEFADCLLIGEWVVLLHFNFQRTVQHFDWVTHFRLHITHR